MTTWTKEEPKSSVNAHYWVRRQDDHNAMWVASLDVGTNFDPPEPSWEFPGHEDIYYGDGLSTWIEWWPIPITPPSEEKP